MATINTDLQTVSESVKSQQSVPYCAVFSVPDAARPLPNDFKAGDYSGLLTAQLAQSDSDLGATLVVTYWISRDKYQAARARLMRELSLTSTIFEGLVTEARTPRRHWWNQSKQTLLLAAAGAVGALITVKNFAGDIFAWFLEAPAITVTAGHGPVQVVEREELVVPVTVRSDFDGKARVKLLYAELSAEGQGRTPIKVTPDLEKPPELRARDTITLNLTVPAPKADAKNPSADVYRLKMAIQAKAGRARWPRTETLERRVEVWPVTACSKGFELEHQERKNALYRGLLVRGGTDTLGASVLLNNEPDISFSLTVEGRPDVIESLPSHDRLTQVGDFSIPPAGNKSTYRVTANLQSAKALTAEQWRAKAGNLSLKCEARR